METPEDLHYTDEHEWIRVVGDSRVRLGITDYAQDQLGDVVFVELPEVENVHDVRVMDQIHGPGLALETYAHFGR